MPEPAEKPSLQLFMSAFSNICDTIYNARIDSLCVACLPVIYSTHCSVGSITVRCQRVKSRRSEPRWMRYCDPGDASFDVSE